MLHVDLRNIYVALPNLRNAHVALSNLRNSHVTIFSDLMSHVTRALKTPCRPVDLGVLSHTCSKALCVFTCITHMRVSIKPIRRAGSWMYLTGN